MAFEEKVSSAEKGGGQLSSDKGGCFQMHLFYLSPSGCSALLKAAGMQQFPAQGHTSHLLITPIQERGKYSNHTTCSFPKVLAPFLPQKHERMAFFSASRDLAPFNVII